MRGGHLHAFDKLLALPNRAGHPHEDIEKNNFVRVTEKQTLVEQREDMVCVCYV